MPYAQNGKRLLNKTTTGDTFCIYSNKDSKNDWKHKYYHTQEFVEESKFDSKKNEQKTADGGIGMRVEERKLPETQGNGI